MPTHSQTKIAEHLDMSTRNLREVLGSLGLDWKDSSLDEIRIAYIRKLRETAAGRGDDKLSDARIRRELADARLKELQFAKENKMIINVDDIEPAIISLFKEILSAVMEAGNKSLQSIENEHNLKLDDNLVLGHLRTALGNIAAGGDKLIANITGLPCASVSKAARPAGNVDRKKSKAAGRK